MPRRTRALPALASPCSRRCAPLSSGAPIGAEADATLLVYSEVFEVSHFGFNAVLRDYARLGRFLAHDGAWDAKQIIPARWMIDATTATPDSYLAPGKA